jgi:hypothetical protein
MEKELKHHEQQDRDERKNDVFISSISSDQHMPNNGNIAEGTDYSRAVKRKRIRAYRRIDYWQ